MSEQSKVSIHKVEYTSLDGWKVIATPTLLGMELRIGIQLDFKRPDGKKSQMPVWLEKPISGVTEEEVNLIRESLPAEVFEKPSRKRAQHE